MKLKYDHLLGKKFELGKTDCFSISRDFYRDNFSIEIRDYARPERFWESGLDLYRSCFEREGFQVVDIPLSKIQPGDGLMVALGVSIATHTGVYVGDNKVLHHFPGRLSEVMQLKGLWRNNLCYILRHKDVKIEEPKTTDFNFMDYLPPHKRDYLKKVMAEHEEAREVLQRDRS